MKKSRRPSPPTPSRGILAAIARELGISRQAVGKRYRSGHPETMAEVAKRERQIVTAKRRAAKKLIEAFGGEA